MSTNSPLPQNTPTYIHTYMHISLYGRVLQQQLRVFVSKAHLSLALPKAIKVEKSLAISNVSLMWSPPNYFKCA